MSKEAQIRAIIDKHLDLDTVHIEYHRESIDMVGHMVREIMQLIDGERVKWCETHQQSAPPCGARMNCSIGGRLLVNPYDDT